jgi:uncharacterized protein YndB with AHSA1/START domain
MPSVRVEIEHRVDAPPERVFAVLADPARRPEWQENTSDVEVLTPGPAGLGARWTETQRGVGRVQVEVVGFAPPTTWNEAGTAHGGGATVSLDLRPDGDCATRVRVTVELTLRGARRLMGPALAPVIRHQVPRDLDRLAALVRSEA